MRQLLVKKNLSEYEYSRNIKFSYFFFCCFRSLIDQYFGGTFDAELKCDEAPDEPVAKSKEQFLQLSCFMSTDVRYMHSGLKSVSKRDLL